MSEQTAMQPDEFDSTNDRLDSILDRLNALGASAAEMKTAPLRPLQRVPDLEPVVADTAAERPVIEPPAIPPLNLVPPTPAPQVQISPVAEAPALAPPQLPTPVADPPSIETPVVHEPAEPNTMIDVPVLTEPAAPIAEAPAVDIAEPTWPVVEADSAEPEQSWPVVEPAPVAPQAAEPGPVEVEYHGLDLEGADPTNELADSILEIVESDEGPLVFDLAPGQEIEDTPAETPGTATSVFGSSPPSTSVPDDGADSPLEEADGWVSHHGSDTQMTATQSVDTEMVETEVVETETGTSIDDDPEFFETPEFSAVETEPAVDETAETIEELNIGFFDVDPAPELPAAFAPGGTEDSFDVFSEVSGSDEATMFDAADSMADSGGLSSDYDSDEELPLPDFTGVYVETETEDGFWGDADVNVPDPVESPMTMARDELDKLRPHDDDEVVVEEKSSASRTVKLQFFLVLMFGLIVLAFVLGDDPQVLDDMRDSISNLFG